MHARDDFLTRIAALVERHGAEPIEIQGLRDIVLGDRGPDGGNAERHLGAFGERRGARLESGG